MALWLHTNPLVLASQSGSRHALLRAAEIPHDIDPAQIDERLLEQSAETGNAAQIAELLAREKALAVSSRRPGSLVLGADQTLSANGLRFSKPVNRASARKQLTYLRGRTHELHSAIAIARDTNVLFEHREVARLTMRDFSHEFLEAYLDAVGSGAATSVGGYQLEKVGIQLFARIEGDHFVILGLPLLALLEYLRREGLIMQ